MGLVWYVFDVLGLVCDVFDVVAFAAFGLASSLVFGSGASGGG